MHDFRSLLEIQLLEKTMIVLPRIYISSTVGREEKIETNIGSHQDEERRLIVSYIQFNRQNENAHGYLPCFSLDHSLSLERINLYRTRFMQQ